MLLHCVKYNWKAWHGGVTGGGPGDIEDETRALPMIGGRTLPPESCNQTKGTS